MSEQGVRWIFGFRRVGRRVLTEAEIQGLQQSARVYSAMKLAYGGFAVSLGLMAVISIIEASGGFRWAWIGFAGFLVAFFYTLSYASQQEVVGLLHRRAARVGQVDTFERAETPKEVRAKFRTWPDPDGDPIECLFWKEEEKLLEWMAKTAGKPATTFETPIDDDVPIFVEGIAVRQVRDVYSITL